MLQLKLAFESVGKFRTPIISVSTFHDYSSCNDAFERNSGGDVGYIMNGGEQT